MKNSILKRLKLNKTLDATIDFPILFVSAPMGYGKTTAIKDYISTKNLNSIWISGLYEDDSIIWKSFCDTLHNIDEDLFKKINTIGLPVAHYQVHSLISVIKNNITSEFVLVIDDYHLFSSRSIIHHLLFAIAVEQIPLFHVVCITRSIPSWLLAELQSKNLCTIVGVENLAFDESEVLEYLRMRNLLGVYGAEDQAKNMWAVTEGWISAIILLAEALRLGHEVSAFETTYILFERTIFNDLSELEKVLLIRLACLESFTIEEATYVLDTDGVAALIEKFRHQELFVTYSPSRNAYKIHELFKGFLLQQAQLLNVATVDVKRKMGEWHFVNKNYGLSMKYYHESGNILHFFESLPYTERHFIPYESNTLCYTIVKSLPIETAIEYPLVYLYFILLLWATAVEDKENLALQIFDCIKKFYVKKKNKHKYRERILCEIHIIQHTFDFNDPYKVFNMKNCISKNMLKEILYPVSSSISFSAWQPSFLFCYFRKTGELKDVVKFITENLDCNLLCGIAYGFDKLLLSEMYIEQCEVKKAKFYARQAITKAKLKDQIHIIACANYILARAAIFEGEIKTSLKHLEIIKFEIPQHLGHLFHHDIKRNYATFVSLCELMIFSTMQNEKLLDLVTHTGKTERKLRDLFICRGFGVYDLIRIKIKIIKQEYHDAEVLCDYYENEYARYPTQIGRLRLQINRAIICYNLDQHDKAHTLLREALDEAAFDNIMMIFAENSEFILPILKNLSKTTSGKNFFYDAVIARCNKFDQGLSKIRLDSKQKILSKREQEIFAMLTKGESLKNIAEILGIAVSTVKSHVDHIYNKLGVTSRIAAINKMATLAL